MPDFPNTKDQNQFILNDLKKRNTRALKQLFDLYAERLFYHALKFVDKTEIAEEIVQDVFIAIWENLNELNIHTSLEAYLYTSIKNRAISYLRKKSLGIDTEELQVAEHFPDENILDSFIEYNELKHELRKTIESLPERCRIIFYLSRNSGLTYKQIATELKISPESVKTQIGIALHRLKVHLKNFRE